MEGIWVSASIDQGVPEFLYGIAAKIYMVDILGVLFVVLTEGRDVHAKSMEEQVSFKSPTVSEPEKKLNLVRASSFPNPAEIFRLGVMNKVKGRRVEEMVCRVESEGTHMIVLLVELVFYVCFRV